MSGRPTGLRSSGAEGQGDYGNSFDSTWLGLLFCLARRLALHDTVRTMAPPVVILNHCGPERRPHELRVGRDRRLHSFLSLVSLPTPTKACCEIGCYFFALAGMRRSLFKGGKFTQTILQLRPSLASTPWRI